MPRKVGVYDVAGRTGQPVAGARDGFDFEASGGDVGCEFPDRTDGAVEAIVTDIDAAPAALEQGFARDHLAGCFGKDDEHLHDPRLDVGGAAGPGDRAARRADGGKAEGEIGPRRELGGGQHPLDCRSP